MFLCAHTLGPINYGPPQFQRLFHCLFLNSSWTLRRFYPPQAVVTERSDVVPCSPPVRALTFYRAYEGSAWPTECCYLALSFALSANRFFLPRESFPTSTHSVTLEPTKLILLYAVDTRTTCQATGGAGLWRYNAKVWKTAYIRVWRVKEYRDIFGFCFHFLSFTFVSYNSRACTYQVALINNTPGSFLCSPCDSSCWLILLWVDDAFCFISVHLF